MSDLHDSDWVALRRCRDRARADHYALVLAAQAIRSVQLQDDAVITLFVAGHDVVAAGKELDAYDSEMRDRPARPKAARWTWPPIEVALAYWAVLLFFFAAQQRRALSVDWVAAGAAQAGMIIDGEWWRAVTALTLHVDASHLLGNLVFGSVFLLLLAQRTGAGAAWLFMIAAGAAGNVVNAVLQPAAHSSIGASTAIFAGLGLLTALRQGGARRAQGIGLRQWAPLAAGVTLLAFLGFSGERTDILAHVLGFAAGVGAGLGLARFPIQTWPADRAMQWTTGAIAGGVLAAAWLAAVMARV